MNYQLVLKGNVFGRYRTIEEATMAATELRMRPGVRYEDVALDLTPERAAEWSAELAGDRTGRA